jgi:serine/threonine-protein kinase
MSEHDDEITEPARVPYVGVIQSLPARLGRYLLTKRLGIGGMAEIFLASQDGPAGFRRPCVVKRVLPHLAEDPKFVEMFQREARVAALLSHTNVVQVYELGEADGSFFLAMEYVDGTALHTLARTSWRLRRPLPLEVVCCAVADAALGLDAAHALNDLDGAPLSLVHRDISPDNLMVNREGVTKVLDFGIARTALFDGGTGTGELKGKLPFTSPEQIAGLALDGRADLYALGVTLYWLLTGQRPLVGDGDLQLMQKIIHEVPRPPKELNPSIPDVVNDLTMKLLEKRRERRPARGCDVHDALADALKARRSVVVPFVERTLLAARAPDTLPERTPVDVVRVAPPDTALRIAWTPAAPVRPPEAVIDVARARTPAPASLPGTPRTNPGLVVDAARSWPTLPPVGAEAAVRPASRTFGTPSSSSSSSSPPVPSLLVTDPSGGTAPRAPSRTWTSNARTPPRASPAAAPPLPTAVGTEPAAKGVVIAPIVAQLKVTMKERGLSTVPGLLDDDLTALRYHRVLATEFYSLDFYHRVTSAAHEVCWGGTDDGARRMGHAAAEHALMGVYRVFFHPGDPMRTLRAAPKLWTAHYRGSFAQVETLEGTGLRVIIRDYGPMPAALQTINLAWVVACARLAGAQDARGTGHERADAFVAEIRWSA